MNISLNPNNTLSPLLSAWERNTTSSTEASATSPQTRSGDVVDLATQNRQARLLDDSEVESTLADTLGLIENDTYNALAVHSGFDASRVAALLA